MSAGVTGSFPAGFLWGAATGAHQVEGGNVGNDYWEQEHAPGTAFAELLGIGLPHPRDLAVDAPTGRSVCYRP